MTRTTAAPQQARWLPLAMLLVGLQGVSAAEGAFVLTSAGVVNGVLPAEYTCDGAGVSPPLSWSGAPEGTREFALLMSTQPRDGGTKWNWVVYNIPASATGLARNTTMVGTAGMGSNGPHAAYQPPCAQGPGAKVYTFTLYALGAAPVWQGLARPPGGAQLQAAIASVTLGMASLSVSASHGTGAEPVATAPPPQAPIPVPAPSAGSGGVQANCAHVRNSLLASTTGTATVSCDSSYAAIASHGLPTHAMMHGITATNLQVPIAQDFTGANAWKIPLNPAIASSTTTATDGPIGVAINGVPIFNPCKQGGCQNGDTKVQGELDLCNGHAGRADDYHYHAAPTCMMAGKPARYWDTHPLGWALDGFAIFGYHNADGGVAERDGICGGNTSPVANAPAGYSYHVTEASPYVLSCFRGTPSPDLAHQHTKFTPLRKPPVQPFRVTGMRLLSESADGYQVLQFEAPRAFSTALNGADSLSSPAGVNHIGYKALTGAALATLLAQRPNAGKSACWEFQFGSGDGGSGQAPQATQSYCR